MVDRKAPYGRDMGGAPLGQSIEDHFAGKPDLLKIAQESRKPHVDSASDDRTANNAVRHNYRVLTDAEKAQMVAIKDKGAEFLALIESLRTPMEPIEPEHGDAVPLAIGYAERELNIAAERVEEAVMWAVKHITA